MNRLKAGAITPSAHLLAGLATDQWRHKRASPRRPACDLAIMVLVRLVACGCAAVALLAAAEAAPRTNGVEQVHLSLGDNPTQMVVMFATMSSDGSPINLKGGPAGSVSWGAKKGGPYTGHAAASATTYATGGTPWPGVLYNATMTGLQPSSRYYYTVTAGGATSAEFSFKAAPPANVAPSYPLKFSIFADMGEECDTPGPGCSGPTIKALEQATADNDFDLLVHAGDIAYTSGTQSIWDAFLRQIQPIAANTPYSVCVGNHEHYFNFTGYLHRWRMPGPDQAVSALWHSYDYGPVHFVGMSTEHDYEAGSAQLAFLKADLARANARRHITPWIVFYAHRPLYCSTDDYYDCRINGPKKLAPVLEPLLKENGVDLFVAGHLHNYERAWPVYNGTVLQKDYKDPAATVHVVAGMAGDSEGLTNKWESPSPAWSAVRDAELGYVRVTVNSAGSLLWELVSAADGSVKDSITITKSK